MTRIDAFRDPRTMMIPDGEAENEHSLDVGIIGAGFAGTAAALYLARQGHRVCLYEEASSPAAIGAGILIQPTGQRALRELGLLDAAVACGSKIEKLVCLTSHGEPVLDLAYDDFEPGWFGLGMHRGALFELLFEAALRAGVEVQSGCSVSKLERGRDRVSPLTSSGARLGSHELVIIADGARSELRDPADIERVRPYPWGALWFVARDPERVFSGSLHQVTDSTTALLGFLPSGTGPRSARGPDLVSVFWSLRTRELGERLVSLSDWKRAVSRLEPRAEAVLDQIRDVEQLLPASYLDVVMSKWHSERVVVIGDAAHAMSPQLGQGTNLALEDARVLARCLTNSGPLARRLASYTRARRRHVRYYQFASRWLTPFFQSSHHPLGALRDLTMGATCRFPPTRALMLATLAGVRNGFWGGNLSLDR
jgi:2-polyprenyl-6-methoxyphenol hydroxylase-like FAD-dependent oxidoreductase